MKILQLGNGGGFDFDIPNSSFLIEFKPKSYLLFDCGFNIMNRLLELQEDGLFEIKNIEYVYISHTHADHIGNLESFIYYNYFVNKKKTKIICNETIRLDVETHVKNCDYEKINGEMVKADMYDIYNEFDLTSTESDITGFRLDMIPSKHGNITNYGMLMTIESNAIYISGDTEADINIEHAITNYIDTLDIRNIIAFHDLSKWDAPEFNIHATKSSIEKVYSKEFSESLSYYHTGTEIESVWIDWLEEDTEK